MLSVSSIQKIEKIYQTGEEPVLVLCSDMRQYVCKYCRYPGSANKLICEYIGSVLAKKMGLNIPTTTLINIQSTHVPSRLSPSFFAKTSIGSQLMESVIDVTPSSQSSIECSKESLLDLLQIALFDIWVANEDRNSNNANLMYQISQGKFVPIDHGCIFNTCTFDYPLSLLTCNDTILNSDLFVSCSQCMSYHELEKNINKILKMFDVVVESVRIDQIMDGLPKDWNVRENVVRNKLHELISAGWVAGVKDTFVEYIKENMTYGK